MIQVHTSEHKKKIKHKVSRGKESVAVINETELRK